MINIKRVVNFSNDQNCYIVYDENKTGFIVDPGSSCDVILDAVNKEGVKIEYILLTHCHYDHIESVEDVRKVFNAKVVSSFECNKNIQNPSVNLSTLFSNTIKASPSDVIVNDGYKLMCGNMEIKVITTPGHTDGGACYLVGEDLFSGDTLFLNSIGRWDFPTGNSDILINSIKNKLYTLDDDIIVHPGHGNDTKIYYEKSYNMYVKGW